MKTIFLFISFITAMFAKAQTFDPAAIKMYWKDSAGIPFMTFERLLKLNDRIVFITGTGKSLVPFGLYIENGKLLHPMHKLLNYKVNLNIQPDGVFYTTGTQAFINSIEEKRSYKNAKWAIQSGPMLLIDGRVNAGLPNKKKTLRHGVGIKKDGRVYFAVIEAGMKDFAKHFLDEGCTNALYLDGENADTWENGSSLKKFSRFGPMIVAEKTTGDLH